MDGVEENYNVLILSNENKFINKLAILFENPKYNFDLARDPLTALSKIKNDKYDLIIVNKNYQVKLFEEILKKIKLVSPRIFTIVITKNKNEDRTIKYIRRYDLQGIYDIDNEFNELLTTVQLILNAVYELRRINLNLDNFNNPYKSPYLRTVNVLRNIVEYKDTYTIGHSFRVSKYSVLIGKALDLTKEELKILKFGSWFHDIGKVGIPNSIITKSTRLTDNEYYQIKKHTLIGAHIVSASKRFNTIIPIIKFHHERYDGKGYPSGFRGDDIPLLVRIVSVADTFDAMNSKRTYRNQVDMDDIIKELKKNRKTQFDPRITDVFLDILKNNYKEIEKIMQTYTVKKSKNFSQ